MNTFSVASVTATCSSLSHRALSGASEIDHILVDRDDDAKKAEFEKLLSLATKLKQIKEHADQLVVSITDASVIAPKLQEVVSALLPECDGAAAIVTKQLMRLGKDTPRESVNLRAVLRYESFLVSTARFLTFASQVFSGGPAESQDAMLSGEEGKLLLAKVGSACKGIAKSGGILLNTPNDEPSSSSKQDVYDGPPPSFEESSSPAFGGPTLAEASGSRDGKAPSGFFNSLADSFKAMTAAIRPKPEPFVVPLCQAATRGNVPQMKGFLGEGANINGRNENGHTALICAILARQLDAVQFLLGAGAIHTVRNSGRGSKPPLFHAIDVGQRATIDLLFSRGVDVNESNDWGQPFFVDLIAGETPSQWIQLLLSRGANANARDAQGQPVVVLALQNRKKKDDREELVVLLLRHGADPNSRDNSGTPLIYHCVQQGRDELISLLLGLGADPKSRDMYGMPMLIEVVKRKDRALAKLLLERGADPNARDPYGVHVLLVILRDSNLSTTDRETMFETFLQHGARGSEVDSWGVTVLDHALAATIDSSSPTYPGSNNFKIPMLLLTHGADPNQRLTKQLGEPTLLTYALERARWDVVRMALSHGANPNVADKKDRTPLLLAMQRGREDIVTLLIQHGADVNQAGKMTPLDLARVIGSRQIMQLLKTHGATEALWLTEEEAPVTNLAGPSSSSTGTRTGTRTETSAEPVGDDALDLLPPYEEGPK